MLVALEGQYELCTKPAKKDTTTSFGLTTRQLQIFTHCATSSNNTGSATTVQNKNQVWSKEKKGIEFQMLNKKKHPSGLHYWDARKSKTGNIFASI